VAGAVVAVTLAVASSPRADTAYMNPVIPGDFPDPTVTRAGGDYWAAATSGDWAPVFQLQLSHDLVNWSPAGAIFDTVPGWTAGAYWAPALSFRNGRFLAYYAARRRGGKPCIGVAVARRGAGPYHDRGPIMCPPRGAIDPEPFSASPRQQFLAFKQMGVGAPLRVAPLSVDGTRVVGRAVAVLHPTRPWERGVTENPFLVAQGGRYYLFYSGGHCCRQPCSYAIGVARGPSPTGPFVKDPAGPVLRGNDAWSCPGGATVVDNGAGGLYVVYHAYARDSLFLGRQTLLDTLNWGADGWPEIGGSDGPSVVAPAPLSQPQDSPRPITESFAEHALSAGWQWPYDRRPRFKLAGGNLVLSVFPGDETASFLGRLVRWRTFAVTTQVRLAGLAPGSTASLALRGDNGTTLGIGVSTRGLDVWRHAGGRRSILFSSPPTGDKDEWLRIEVADGADARLQAGPDGVHWRDLLVSAPLFDGDDRARMILAGRGRPGATVSFGLLSIEPL